MRRLLGLLALVTTFVLTAGAACAPVGREFTRPTATQVTPGVSSIDEWKRVVGEPTRQLVWSRNEGVFRTHTDQTPLPTPFANTSVGGTVRRLYYYYAWKLGEPVRAGVEPARSLYAWFWNDKLVAYSATSSFKTDPTSFDDARVQSITPWKSLRDDVVRAFGPPSGVAVYPAAPLEGQEVLSYRGFEWDTAKNQYESKSLYVLVNNLGIVEDLRFSGSTTPIPPPVPTGGGVPIQIYTPPRTRGK